MEFNSVGYHAPIGPCDICRVLDIFISERDAEQQTQIVPHAELAAHEIGMMAKGALSA
jgi:hypothetical protein